MSSYEDRLVKAISYLTGGEVQLHVRQDSRWHTVVTVLKREGIEPEEYCYYISHHSTGAHNAALLVQINRLQSATTIEAFKKHRKEVNEYIPTTIRSQTYCFDSRVKAGMEPTELLLDPLMSFDPIMRVELALRNATKHNIDVQAILDKYEQRAIYMLFGYPAYGDYCLKVKERLTGERNDGIGSRG